MTKYFIPDWESLRKQGFKIEEEKPIKDVSVVTFEAKKPLRIELYGKIQDAEVYLEGEKHPIAVADVLSISQELSKKMKCKMISPDKLVCTIETDKVYGHYILSPKEQFIALGESKKDNLYWV